jgi:hypothetical protein
MRTLTCWICTLGLAGGLVFGVFEQVAEADVYVDSRTRRRSPTSA